MGLITRLFDVENDVTVFTVVGDVDAEQVLSHIIAFLTGAPTPLVLWDITGDSLAGLSSKDLRMIVERAAPFADRRQGGRTTIVCSQDLDYDFSRMFQTFAELHRVPIAMQVFRHRDAARAWLHEAR